MSKSMHKTTKRASKIGEVVFLSEKIQLARELSSCCVGTEALLEAACKPGNLDRRKPELKGPR